MWEKVHVSIIDLKILVDIEKDKKQLLLWINNQGNVGESACQYY